MARVFRNNQPKTLIVWGKNDPFFTVEGAQAYLRDIPERSCTSSTQDIRAGGLTANSLQKKIVGFFV